jgi:hypothetical protein
MHNLVKSWNDLNMHLVIQSTVESSSAKTLFHRPQGCLREISAENLTEDAKDGWQDQ